jgi:hypothetical protein
VVVSDAAGVVVSVRVRKRSVNFFFDPEAVIGDVRAGETDGRLKP